MEGLIAGSVIRLSPIAALASLTACAFGPQSVPSVIDLPAQSIPPVAAEAGTLDLLDGAIPLADLRDGRSHAVLGAVRKGSLHVVVMCDGVGVTPVRVDAVPGKFTVPCAPGGEISYNTIVFQRDQRNVTVWLSGDGDRRVEARIGWDPSLPKPPTGEDLTA
jgi:hypothetical protein